MKLSKLATVYLGTVTLVVSAMAIGAERFDLGKWEYDASCASCHGRDGKGAGPFAQMLQVRMPDLTMLSKNNGGVFPIARVYNVIDGREEVKAHGTREMPIWGTRLTLRVAPDYADYNADAAEVFVRARILAVIDYLYRLQAK
jgi:mono/diheme cytochrome c family protein